MGVIPQGGRFKAGEHNIAAILTPELVLEMRQLRAQGWSYTKLSDRYAIDRKHAWRICNRIAWSWLND